MISHVVLLRFKPGVSADSVAAREAHAAMLELPAKIPFIRDWRCGFNVTPDPLAYDYILVSGFDTQTDLFAYFDHPDHLKVVARWEPIADLVFGDMEET